MGLNTFIGVHETIVEEERTKKRLRLNLNKIKALEYKSALDSTRY